MSLKRIQIEPLKTLEGTRRWVCVIEVSGKILRADIRVSERDSESFGHSPAFWAKQFSDAFQKMLIDAMVYERLKDEHAAESSNP